MEYEFDRDPTPASFMSPGHRASLLATLPGIRRNVVESVGFGTPKRDALCREMERTGWQPWDVRDPVLRNAMADLL